MANEKNSFELHGIHNNGLANRILTIRQPAPPAPPSQYAVFTTISHPTVELEIWSKSLQASLIPTMEWLSESYLSSASFHQTARKSNRGITWYKEVPTAMGLKKRHWRHSMLYNRLLNCRASGLLEQTDAPKPDLHGFPDG